HGIVLDSARRQVTRNGEYIRLAHKEFAVLATLMAADGAVVSAEELLERVWDENIDPFSNTVRVTMSKLRAKLGDPQVIRTVPGSGYLI
uniref:winged helix-turn-helix domain-containing protein n=1 Tax=Embleya scabrispora TaxID=159449 RepID=UPI0003782625